MNNIKKGLIGLSILTVMLSGCGVTQTTNAGTTPAAKNSTKSGDSKTTDKRGNFVKVDLMGEITTIVGNEATLKLIEMPQRKNNGGTGTPGAQSGQANQETTKSTTNSLASGLSGSGSGMGGPGGGMGGPGGGMGGLGESGSTKSRTVKYTGEVKSITLPVGIPIMKMVTSKTSTTSTTTTTPKASTGSTTKEIDMKDLKKGDILSITYSDDAKTVISKITVRTSTSG